MSAPDIPEPTATTTAQLAEAAEWLRDAVADMADRNYAARHLVHDFDCARFADELDRLALRHDLESLASSLRALADAEEEGEFSPLRRWA